MDFINNLFKCFVAFFKFEDEDKLVKFDYPFQIGIAEKLFWCNPEKLEKRLKEGYKVYFQRDFKLRKRYRFINKSNQILMHKPKGEAQEEV